MSASILVVEDEEPIQILLSYNLESEGYRARHTAQGEDVQRLIGEERPDLILLDWMLPGISGIEVCRMLRSRPETRDIPIIMLTARSEEAERVRGLATGADDYLVKPFDLSELSARLNAVARRYAGNPNPLVRIGNIEIDLAARSILRAGRTIDLTAREWALFEAFVQRPGQILSRAQLEERLYSFGAEVESNATEVHISRLRKKLGHDVIETVRGVGYRLGRVA